MWVNSAASDEEIALLVQQGDKEQFGVLIERYEPKLLRYGRKFLADRDDIVDIVQDAFISAYQNIQSFDASQRFSPWMYRIAHNAFVNALRRNSRNPVSFMDLDTLVSHPAYEDPAQTQRDREDMRALVEKGLLALSPKYREVLILYYLEELAYREIADILGVPVGTVGIRIKRAKQALREEYQRQHIDYGA